MACVYVIAGPPGIGKSTSGYRFIPENVNILDADMIAHRYKKQGFQDYKDIGNIRYQDMFRRSLVSGEDPRVYGPLCYANGKMNNQTHQL